MTAALLSCVCVCLRVGVCFYDCETGCLYLRFACPGLLFSLFSAFHRGRSHWKAEGTYLTAPSSDQSDALPLSLLLPVCLYSASQV